MAEEIQFQDAENFSIDYNKDKISFRDIILNHLRRILVFASVEYRGGGYEEKTVITNGVVNTVKIYVSDTREVYSNAVEVFADCLLPYFDKDMKDAEKKYENSIEFSLKVKEETKDEELAKNNYRNKKREASRFLFRALCSFLWRKKYLDIGVMED